MASSTTAAQIKRVVWSWQSNPNPWDETREKTWQAYPDITNEFIETAYQKRELKIDLRDYILDFTNMKQIHKLDIHKQRRVKREEIDISQHLRVERFLNTEHPRSAVKSFDEGRGDKPFTNAWLAKYPQLQNNNALIVEQVAKGIEEEGERCGEGLDAKIMADKLRVLHEDQCDRLKAADNDADRENLKRIFRKELSECCMRLYTAESFLYKLMNATLRNEDMSKIDTLGAYCFLLESYVYFATETNQVTLYRGCKLTDELFEVYKKAVGTEVNWLSFSSATKDRRQAERFGNALFIIRLNKTRAFNREMEVSSISFYPSEEEVLLNTGHMFRIDKVELDPTANGPSLEDNTVLLLLEKFGLRS